MKLELPHCVVRRCRPPRKLLNLEYLTSAAKKKRQEEVKTEYKAQTVAERSSQELLANEYAQADVVFALLEI